MAGSPGATREALRWNEPNSGKGVAAKRIPRGSEPNLQNEANFTLNVNKMKSLMRETPRRFYAERDWQIQWNRTRQQRLYIGIALQLYASIRADAFPGDRLASG